MNVVVDTCKLLYGISSWNDNEKWRSAAMLVMCGLLHVAVGRGGVRHGGASGRRLRYRGSGASPDPCGDDSLVSAPPPWPGPRQQGSPLAQGPVPLLPRPERRGPRERHLTREIVG